MPSKFTYDEVRKIAQGNRLRQFPTESKGRARLLPYARPRVERDPIALDAGFFALGACFARSVERELASMGRRVLSSPTGVGLPGSSAEQFQRYNIFNLDVALNELTWALEGDEDALEAALLPMGGQLADTQISWTFAHDPGTARTFRGIYNASYKRIADADVVFILAGGLEQWFDTRHGIYINSMPGPVAERLFPGRFGLHRIDAQAARATIENVIALVRRHSRRDPHFILGVSPVSQPMVYGPEDALVDQFYAKVVQRQAVEDVLRSDPGTSYFPALETAMWSDFAHDYMPASPNHTTANFAARVVSDLLDAAGATDLAFVEHKAKAHGTALLAGGDSAGAIALCEEALAAGSHQDLALDRLYLRALTASRQRARAFRHVLGRIQAGHNVSEFLKEAPAAGRGLATSGEKQFLRQAAMDRGLPVGPIDAMAEAREETESARLRFREVAEVMAGNDHATVIRLGSELLEDKPELSPRELARLHQMLIRANVAAGAVSTALALAMEVVCRPELLREPVALGAAEALLRRYGSVEQLEQALARMQGDVDDARLALVERALSRRRQAPTG